MKRHHSIVIFFLSLFVILSSCLTHKKLTYLQNIGSPDRSIMQSIDMGTTVTPIIYKVMSYDVLYINVVTPDPKWSVLFNTGSGGTLTEESATLSGYPVDNNGNIELPFVGSQKVVGKTLSEIKVDLDSILKNYVTDASITVRMVNNYVSVIGEVNRPGRYPLTKYRVNVFEALAMAGDMSVYSNRQNVQLIRQSQYGPIVKEFSLKDRSILTSDFFYIMPNDIIYAMPLKSRLFQINSSAFSLILSSFATILGSVTTLFVIFGYNR